MADTVILHREGDSPPPHPRGVSYTKPIDRANEVVAVLDLAGHLSGAGVRRGKEVLFRCPLHDDRNPSLRVDPAKDVWYCDPCGVGRDVVRLAQLAWGYPVEESHIAAAELLMLFGHDLPQRPPSWFRKQERQRPVRDAIDRERFAHLRRRLFRAYFKTSVLAIEDEAEREAEYDILWDATEPLAEMLLDRLSEERRSA